MIASCPNCTGKLANDVRLAQGVKKCKNCGGVYFIIETTIPYAELEEKARIKKLNYLNKI